MSSRKALSLDQKNKLIKDNQNGNDLSARQLTDKYVCPKVVWRILFCAVKSLHPIISQTVRKELNVSIKTKMEKRSINLSSNS